MQAARLRDMLALQRQEAAYIPVFGLEMMNVALVYNLDAVHTNGEPVQGGG